MADGRDLGTIINERRLALGYSLGQLANRVGTTASKVRSWERGSAVPDEPTVTKLAEELNLDVAALNAALPAPPARKRDEGDDATAAVAAPVFSDAGDTVAAGSDEPTPTPAPRAAAKAEQLDPGPRKKEAADAEPDEAAAEPDEAAAEPDGAATAARVRAEEPDAEPEESTAVVAALDPSEEADDAKGGDGGDEAVDRPDEETQGSAAEIEVDQPVISEPRMADLPTEAVPVIVADEPAPAGVATVLAAPPSTAPAPTTAPAAAATQDGGFLAPVEQFFNTVFDPKKRYLFWIRTALTVLVFLVFLRVLAWAVPAFFDALNEILDTIESTPTEVEPGIVIEGLSG